VQRKYSTTDPFARKGHGAGVDAFAMPNGRRRYETRQVLDGKFEGDSDLQLERINVYYEEGSGGGRYFPRAIGIDLEGARLERLLSEKSGRMFRPDCFIGGQEGGSNNYARGYFSDGHDLLERVMDVSRRETERCDSPQGFQILHGVGGGTGAGLTGLLLERLKDEFMESYYRQQEQLPVFRDTDDREEEAAREEEEAAVLDRLKSLESEKQRFEGLLQDSQKEH